MTGPGATASVVTTTTTTTTAAIPSCPVPIPDDAVTGNTVFNLPGKPGPEIEPSTSPSAQPRTQPHDVLPGSQILLDPEVLVDEATQALTIAVLVSPFLFIPQSLLF